MENDVSTCLISPLSGLPLKKRGGFLETDGGDERFQIKNGIACLLDRDGLDDFRRKEMSFFDGLNIKGVPYFRDALFKKINCSVKALIGDGVSKRDRGFNIAEMGGGEGHWAKSAKNESPEAQVFVCDLSMKTLERAPNCLKKICADIARPIFRKNSISLASFWVSLHHLSTKDRLDALKNVIDSLEEGGILLLFEPNQAFFARKIAYNTGLRKDLYPDEHEQAIDFSEISKSLKTFGLTEEAVYFTNPPYNPDFVKKLKNWTIYMAVVESLYQLEKWLFNPVLGGIFSGKRSRLKKYLSLYGAAVYRKRTPAGMNKTCLACGSGKVPRRRSTVASYGLMECPGCGLQFLSPAPDGERLKAIYADYYKSWGLAESGNEVSGMKAKTFKGYLDNILPVAPSGRLLDIGCATGELLDAAKDSGYDVYGTEVSAEGLARCREKFGKDRILEGNLKPGDFQQAFFDVITLFDVIEHMPSPSALLKIVSDLLRPSGILMIVTPDTSSWTRRLLGKRWPHYKEEHIYYYNKDNIARMLAPYFEILDIKMAKKTLSINYVKNIMGAYSNKGFLSVAAGIIAALAGRMKFYNFKIGIGEMLVLCRKPGAER